MQFESEFDLVAVARASPEVQSAQQGLGRRVVMNRRLSRSRSSRSIGRIFKRLPSASTSGSVTVRLQRSDAVRRSLVRS